MYEQACSNSFIPASMIMKQEDKQLCIQTYTPHYNHMNLYYQVVMIYINIIQWLKLHMHGNAQDERDMTDDGRRGFACIPLTGETKQQVDPVQYLVSASGLQVWDGYALPLSGVVFFPPCLIHDWGLQS